MAIDYRPPWCSPAQYPFTGTGHRESGGSGDGESGLASQCIVDGCDGSDAMVAGSDQVGANPAVRRQGKVPLPPAGAVLMPARAADSLLAGVVGGSADDGAEEFVESPPSRARNAATSVSSASTRPLARSNCAASSTKRAASSS